MRRYAGRFECAEPGCSEVAHTEYSTRRDQTEAYRRYFKTPWRCVRHSQPQEVLSIVNPKRITEVISKRHFTDSVADIGLYFNSCGFVHGPGFKAFAKDFPEGTKLVVTAEIVLPDDQECLSELEKAEQAKLCSCRGADDMCPCQNVRRTRP